MGLKYENLNHSHFGEIEDFKELIHFHLIVQVEAIDVLDQEVKGMPDKSAGKFWTQYQRE